jgi:hypothetical protein
LPLKARSEYTHVFNELFHVWVDQILEEREEAAWLYKVFRSLAEADYEGNEAALEEAMSETVAAVVMQILSKVDGFNAEVTYRRCAESPAHGFAQPLRDRKLSTDAYAFVLYVLMYGSGTPPGAGAPTGNTIQLMEYIHTHAPRL